MLSPSVRRASVEEDWTKNPEAPNLNSEHEAPNLVHLEVEVLDALHI